jgi:hypothetical protein
MEGRLAIATNAGWMRWTRICRKARDINADGEGVWSWHPWAGAKFADGNPQATVIEKVWTPRRARE